MAIVGIDMLDFWGVHYISIIRISCFHFFSHYGNDFNIDLIWSLVVDFWLACSDVEKMVEETMALSFMGIPKHYPQATPEIWVFNGLIYYSFFEPL